GYGNNIYLDNIVLSGSCAPFVAIDNSLNAKPEVRIYPNPSEGVFTINLNEIYASGIDISIYNLIGQKVWNQNFPVQSGEFGTQLDLRHLPKSAYFLHANWEKNHISQKILVR
ncbi:MAG: T9SS type A sorting domain-containing protein, partial [Bacteroidetes bacterium]|nr:T9SS type A sorting domain-containing protein [Bacteroidota bacterium]